MKRPISSTPMPNAQDQAAPKRGKGCLWYGTLALGVLLVLIATAALHDAALRWEHSAWQVRVLLAVCNGLLVLCTASLALLVFVGIPSWAVVRIVRGPQRRELSPGRVHTPSDFWGGLLVLTGFGLFVFLVALPSYRSLIQSRLRSQAGLTLREARLLDAARDRYALEHGTPPEAAVSWDDLLPFIQAKGKPSTEVDPSEGRRLRQSGGKDIFGNPYLIVPQAPRIRVHPRTKEALSDATGGDAFWGPFS